MDTSPQTIMRPEDIVNALNDSVDSDWHSCDVEWCQTMWCEEHRTQCIENLLSEKLDDCGSEFIEKITTTGFRKAICIQVMYDGTWRMGNGHHRLAIAFFNHMANIPVVFSFTDDYMCYNQTTFNNA